MASPFSDLPPDLHDSLRPSWLQDARPASILLGKPDGDKPTAETSGIADLPKAVHLAVNQEVTSYVRERNEAIVSFLEQLRSYSGPIGKSSERSDESLEESQEQLIEGFIAQSFESKCLPLSIETLQVIVDKVTETTLGHWFSPLFTVWSDKLKMQGIKKPVLELTWPKHLAERRINFGEGMRDVDLHITGNVNGEIGEDAVNCNITLDTFKGHVGDRAVGCTFRADSIDGSVLLEAKDSSLVCKSLNSPNISLGDGCTLEAETVKGTIREDFDIDEEANDVHTKPCTITIDHLTGSVEGCENWTVNIGKITAPPKRAPRNYQHEIPSKNEIYGKGDKKDKSNSDIFLPNIINSKDDRQYFNSLESTNYYKSDKIQSETKDKLARFILDSLMQDDKKDKRYD